MNRLQTLCKRVDDQFDTLEKTRFRSFVYAHIHAVTLLALQLAKKRGIDPELAGAAARLHDIYTLTTLESEDHAGKGAVLAEQLLRETGQWQETEIRAICSAIASHSEKDRSHGPLEDLLIDADVLEHCLQRFPGPVREGEEARWAALQNELGL